MGEYAVLLRRFAVLVALMFWQGGFTFYAGVVVPTGAKVLGSHAEQGFITREVAGWLNLTAAIALLPLAWDTLAERVLRKTRIALWLAMLACLLFLVWFYPQLDAQLDVASGSIADRKVFRALHKVYLWTATVQWGFCVAYILAMLKAWGSPPRKLPI